MAFFILKQSPKVKRPIQLLNIDSKQYKYHLQESEFEELDKLVVGYFQNKKGLDRVDILANPTFLVSSKIKELFELYDENIRFKGIQLFSVDEKDTITPLYWVPYFEKINCLHTTTCKYTTGLIQELVLDGSKIVNKDIFSVANTVEHIVIVSLSVAESLLRRELYGIGLERVKVR